MISAPIEFLPDNVLLWEVDVDEFWSIDQIIRLNYEFGKNPERTAASFYCRFFVGPDRIADNIGMHGNNSRQEWRRVWRYRTGDTWQRHEPPSLMRTNEKGDVQDVMSLNSFSHEETWCMGLIFDHFAYSTEQQLQFKEDYYGYKGAKESFQKMSSNQDSEILVKEYYSWIKDPIWAFKIKK